MGQLPFLFYLKKVQEFSNKKSNLILTVSFIIAIFVFLKNAWISDDSYIVFRSIEQLFGGNGPRWNPHERVQVFTSPLWFWLLSFVRIFSSDFYLNAILISLFLWISIIFVLNKLFEDRIILFISIFFLIASTAFFDFTSSGLENVLGYFLIALYSSAYIRLFSFNINEGALGAEFERKLIKAVPLLFGLIICVRHDLALLLLPPTIYVIRTKSQFFPKKLWGIIIIVSLAPFMLWSLFSLLYYGFPFPNTAYAKLNTGIDKIVLFKQGSIYLLSSLWVDPITLVVMGTSMILSSITSVGKHFKYLGFGIILNLLYIIYIGGDFMQGRFLSYAYFVSVIMLLFMFDKTPDSKGGKLVFWISIVLYALIYPHTPLNSSLNYSNRLFIRGIADERGCYYKSTSLIRYITCFIANKESDLFPPLPWSFDGFKFKNNSDIIKIGENIGIFGYWAGVNKIIIDQWALADPLLARMPARKGWRVGHYSRDIPSGYIESILNNNEVITDKQINEFYKKLKIITQSNELLSMERLQTIILFNIGAYNNYLHDM